MKHSIGVGTYYPARFTIDDMTSVAGYLKDDRTMNELVDGTARYSEYWNGWGRPSFTLEQGLAIVDAVRKVDSGMEFLWYDKEQDAFFYKNTDWPDGDNIEKFHGYMAALDTGEPVRLYAIGAGSWTWDILVAGELEENEDDKND